MKKVCATIFFLFTALSIYGLFVGNNLAYMNPVSLAVQFIIYALFVYSGIFLWTFDSPSKKSFSVGAEMRRKQNRMIIILFIIYIILYLMSVQEVWTVWIDRLVAASDNNKIPFILMVLIVTGIYFFGAFIFIPLLTIYEFSYRISRKNCGDITPIINEYETTPEAFRDISGNGTVLAGENALIFPKLFCVIPYDKIDSAKYVNILITKSIIFKFKTGKMLEIPTSKHAEIKRALAEYKERAASEEFVI